jgi:predicted RNA-binding protein YlxR (DUF448 family)
VPIRRCVSCRRPAAKTSLLRLVVADGVVSVDPLARKPGRGAYLCGRSDCTDAALRRDGATLRRALRAEGRVRVDEAAVRRGSQRHAEAVGGMQEPGPTRGAAEAQE